MYEYLKEIIVITFTTYAKFAKFFSSVKSSSSSSSKLLSNLLTRIKRAERERERVDEMLHTYIVIYIHRWFGYIIVYLYFQTIYHLFFELSSYHHLSRSYTIYTSFHLKAISQPYFFLGKPPTLLS